VYQCAGEGCVALVDPVSHVTSTRRHRSCREASSGSSLCGSSAGINPRPSGLLGPLFLVMFSNGSWDSRSGAAMSPAALVQLAVEAGRDASCGLA
jgi:hypothetical protein